jgi:polyhydroxyalkanoate synthase
MRDFARCLPNSEAMVTHLAVERWSLAEKPLAARLFEDVWEQPFRADRFMAGTLAIGARSAAPGAVTAPPLCAVDARCSIAPPESMLPFSEAASSRERKLLWYEGDRGVSLEHVGMLVGSNGHRTLWPEIAGWMAALAAPASADPEFAGDHAPPKRAD